MKNSLNKKGLSMSEAQSISNICNQKALDIAGKLSVINNYSRIVKIDGVDYAETVGNTIPNDVVNLVLLKAKYHATQAFLMENIKAKDSLITSLKRESFVYEIPSPIMGTLEQAKLVPEVDDEWGREQLTLDEVNDYLLQEAISAHVGQFIHKRSILANLRDELPNLKKLDWIEIETGKKTPVVITTHHTQEQLSKVHEEFSGIHREAEQKVNYYKAKIKNLITAENARIAEVNALELTRVNSINSSIRDVYNSAFLKWREDYGVAEKEFEATRKKKIQEASALKITTAPQFKETVDEILNLLSK